MLRTSSVLLAAVAVANADIYLHNPRGSNNRLDEANRDRNNGNRLFDSQNNNRGGNNVGQVYYFEGSKIPVEWTNQHSCGGPNNHCEMIIQYMCDDRLRDGTTTRTIPTKPIECYGWDCDTDVRYGRHESWDYYMNCANRERNKGLFTADQNLNGNTAIYTRQNPNGARRGYECPEERDYYPYWGASPWKDVAILTNQPQRCAAYQAESQNVKSRWFCDLPYTARAARGNKPIPINQADCEVISYFDKAMNKTYVGAWREQKAWGIPAPICQDNTWSRDNHLGNVAGGHTAGWNWTVPNTPHEQCAFRLRYNISTGDLPHFEEDPEGIRTNPASLISPDLTAENNGVGSGRGRRKGPAKIDVASMYGVPMGDSALREYNIQNNPVTDMFGSLLTSADGITPAPTQPGDKPSDGPTLYPPPAGGAPSVGKTGPIRLQLAINTAQYGRTFQDRTHKFAIRARDPQVAGATIHNLQVRGKRGNVVQTYPGTEYDFTPNRLACKNGDFIHFQWTGSNTNPNNNAGQGKQGTDRHNVVLLRGKNYDEVGQDQNSYASTTYGQFGNSYPARIDDPASPFLGLAKVDLQHLAILDTPGGQFGGEMSELDDAGTSFDLGLRQCTQNGVYHYMCTRNNNFSNRSQKAKIVVSEEAVSALTLGWGGGEIVVDGSKVSSAQGALNNPQTVVVTTYPSSHPTSFESQEGAPSSKFVGVTVENSNGNAFSLNSGEAIVVSVSYEDNPVGYSTMYRADSLQGAWTEVEDATFEDGLATASINQGGFFVVQSTTNVAAIVFITIGVVGVLGGAGYFMFKKFRSSDLQHMRGV